MNQPAFPNSWIGGNVKKPTQYIENGMDLRDYFAANAPIEFTDLDIVFGFHWDEFNGKELITKLAIARYDYADAMIKAREQ